MSQFIDIHEAGERIFTMSDKGELKAHKVQADGSVSRMDAALALAEQSVADKQGWTRGQTVNNTTEVRP